MPKRAKGSATSEGALLRSIMDYLAAEHILAFRMSVGAVASEYKGRQRFMRFGTPGMADILAFPTVSQPDLTKGGAGQFYQLPSILWIEVKTEKGKQSQAQRMFQKTVEEIGHRYVIARSVVDVFAAL